MALRGAIASLIVALLLAGTAVRATGPRLDGTVRRSAMVLPQSATARVPDVTEHPSGMAGPLAREHRVATVALRVATVRLPVATVRRSGTGGLPAK